MKLINMKWNFKYASPKTMKMTMYDILNKYIDERSFRLEAWLECDLHYDPLKIFQVTKVKFNHKLELTHVELTEGDYE